MLCTFLFQKKQKDFSESALYKTLSQENLGMLDDDKRLFIIAGMDYIPQELIEIFESVSGVEVVMDIFDSNDILEAKLLAGGIKYDIVFPTAWPHFSRQLKAGIYQKLDKKQIDMSCFDEDLLKRLEVYDTDNSYAVPFQFGISGIGMDEKLVEQLVGNVSKDSLSIMFDPANAKKLSKHRISVYESPGELFPTVLAYLGLNPESEKEDDIIRAAEHLKKIRPYITKFSSFGFEDLACGNACVVLSTSGDILRVRKDNANPNIKFFFPREGASLWIDVAAIPIKASHIKNIYAFFRFLFHPMVIAEVTNATSRANAVTKATQYVNEDLRNDPNVYPNENIRRKCYIEKPLPSNLETLKTRLLSKIKVMDN
ncbi:MAG: extracellular solute-binding protein [Holosporaceae bacterium]|nr:extracellular solute-binding protein [Holosporaceae bacterium]